MQVVAATAAEAEVEATAAMAAATAAVEEAEEATAAAAEAAATAAATVARAGAKHDHPLYRLHHRRCRRKPHSCRHQLLLLPSNVALALPLTATQIAAKFPVIEMAVL